MNISFKLLIIFGVLLLNFSLCSLPTIKDQIITPTGSVTPTLLPEKLDTSHQFSNSDLTVQYPDNFFRFNEIWPDLGDFIQHNPEYETDEILNIGDGKLGSKGGYRYRIAVMQRPYSPDLDMEQVYKDAYSSVQLNYPDKEFTREDTTLAGKYAVQFTLERPSGEPWWRVRDIWIVHNQSIYIFTYWAYPSRFEDGLHYFEETIATIQFLD